MEKYEIVWAMFRPDMPGGFDYRPALVPLAKPQVRLGFLPTALDWY